MMAPPAGTQPECLIIGCGYLGQRVAARWTAAGRAVAALTRRNVDTLRNLGVAPVVGDILDPASLRGLPAAETVLYALGMDRTSGRSMREVYCDGLRHVLDTLPAPRRFVYVSSTGVYGQTDGSWVDESSPTEPTEESGHIVLEAERLLREKLPAAVVLRFAGIYGPDRLLRRPAVLKGEALVGDAQKWLNLIHVEDGASAVLAAEAHGSPGQTYNVADDEPVSRRDFYTLLAELLRAPPARFEPRDEPGANRRVSNRKARFRLNWSPHFPHFRAGLPAAVRASTS
jgi:nucleoside-diphosphate-sugar epimerase